VTVYHLKGFMPQTSEPVTIVYEFNLPDSTSRRIVLTLDPVTLIMQREMVEEAPEPWTALEYRQCSNCPLRPDTTPRCPVAVNLSSVVHHFKDMISFDRALIKVETKERTYLKESSIQAGLFSVFGLVMATSRCPHMEFLRPMARFHLPFSSSRETITRVASSYLLGQYFLAQEGKDADWSLEYLDELYQNITLVNRGILSRIKERTSGDASVNSIAILDSFSQLLQMELASQLEKIRPLYR